MIRLKVNDKEIANILKTLNERVPEQMRGKVLLRAMKAGARPIVKSAKGKVPVGSGALRDSIGTWTDKKRMARNRLPGSIAIGPKRSNTRAMAKYINFYGKRSVKTATSGIRHGHLVEFGAMNVKSGKQIPSNAFLGPALQQHYATYGSNVAKALKGQVEAAVRKGAKGFK